MGHQMTRVLHSRYVEPERKVELNCKAFPYRCSNQVIFRSVLKMCQLHLAENIHMFKTTRHKYLYFNSCEMTGHSG